MFRKIDRGVEIISLSTILGVSNNLPGSFMHVMSFRYNHAPWAQKIRLKGLNEFYKNLPTRWIKTIQRALLSRIAGITYITVTLGVVCHASEGAVCKTSGGSSVYGRMMDK